MPTRTLFGDYDTIDDRPGEIQFRGAVTRGAICAGSASLRFVYKADIISRTGPTVCQDTFRRWFKVTFEAANSTIPEHKYEKSGEEFARLMEKIPTSEHGGTWPFNEAYVDYSTLERVENGEYLKGRFAATLEEACLGTAAYTTMPHERKWKSPVESYQCAEKSILHAVLEDER